MDKFKNNKEGKMDKLKVLPPLWNVTHSLNGFSSQANIQKQKATLQKQAVKVKTQQKEMQMAALELEQIKADIESVCKIFSNASAEIEKNAQGAPLLMDKVAMC
ncbi:hypothetical protein F5148DRAFT_1149372 [Russula earlei]|uniref:Uncharacterized protein n=1 Tax=Russula earlei TaxID=71964 RepID=A0ACC0UA84_9AGAM|nr:hypothetical protein F5148DRAFT_1149372 [Russula earlei]